MKTNKLYRYMRLRSKIERMKWGISEKFLEEMFRKMVKQFRIMNGDSINNCSDTVTIIFGVHLDTDGNLLLDEQEPCEGFLDDWNEIENKGLVTN